MTGNYTTNQKHCYLEIDISKNVFSVWFLMFLPALIALKFSY